MFLTFADPPMLPAQPDLRADPDRAQFDVDLVDAAALIVTFRE